MTVLKIENFSGISPRWSARLIQPNMATVAANAKLLSGELRGFHETQLLHDFNPNLPTYPIARAFRIPETITSPTPIQPSDNWISFYDPNVDFIRSPVVGDSFERYYWTGDSYNLGGAPQYNTRARILAANPPLYLGVPQPVNTPVIAQPAGVVSTRSYIYTFVSAYGEEGSPSNAATATGGDGTWVISGFDTTVPNTANRNITTVRIYRTVTGATSAEYYWVADIALGTTSYNDTALDQYVALNFTIPSLTWLPPPPTLLGLVAHPGGFLVGFSGRDLYLSHPYQPHAWPVEYIQTCQTEIAGVAIFGNVIIVMTTSHPYYAEGMDPRNITLQKLDSIDPCISRRSIATTVDGVYYSSPQGIIRHTGGSTELVTRQLFTRQEWQEYFSPTTVYAVPYGVEYIAFDTAATGFIFSPTDGSTPLTQLDRFSNVEAIQQDPYSGDVYIVQNNQARIWDPPSSVPYYYTWTSKEFDLPNPLNFGAFRVKFNSGTTSVPVSLLSDYTTYNAKRITSQLAPINSAPLNAIRTLEYPTFSTPGYSPPFENQSPLGGSSLYQIQNYSNIQNGVVVQVSARDLSGNWNQVFSYSVTTEDIYRLPTGFRSDVWKFTMIGNAPVYSFTIAETAKELKRAEVLFPKYKEISS